MIEWLEPVDAREMPADVIAQGAASPMRMVTRAAAAEVGVWRGDTPTMVRRTFDALAAEWHTRHRPDRLVPLVDAFTRGGPLPDHGTWLEVGCGDGWATSTIARHAPSLVAVDLSMEMLARAQTPTPLVQADASSLPVADHAATVVVLMNMLLFPLETDRVLAPGGDLVWVNSRAEATPIHLTPEQVAAALPGRWGGVAARNGTAIWSVLRRLG